MKTLTTNSNRFTKGTVSVCKGEIDVLFTSERFEGGIGVDTVGIGR